MKYGYSSLYYWCDDRENQYHKNVINSFYYKTNRITNSLVVFDVQNGDTVSSHCTPFFK